MAPGAPSIPTRVGVGGSGLYEAVGGRTMCRELATVFYSHVAKDPLLRPLFPGKTFNCAIEELAAFLAQLLGGPSEDAERRWWVSLRESHLRFKIGQKQRDAWMKNMVRALDEVKVREPMQSALRRFFEQSSAYLINQGKALSFVADEGKSSVDDGVGQQIAHRWDIQRAVDEAVAAVRDADAERAIALASSSKLQDHFKCDRSVFVGLLAVMIAGRHKEMLEYVAQTIVRDPALVEGRYAGRTLLHTAAGRGNVSIVELLLGLGADPNVGDNCGHTPLYYLGNECQTPDGWKLVQALVRAGADVNRRCGVKQCTALHMAARRGTVEVAKALLDCGADLEARDTRGDTPLRRSVNCDKTEVAALLLSRGADIHSEGSKGFTPVLAARTEAMRRVFSSKKNGPG